MSTYQYIPYIGSGTNQPLIGSVELTSANATVLPLYKNSGSDLSSIVTNAGAVVAYDTTVSSVLTWNRGDGWQLTANDDFLEHINSNLANLMAPPEESGAFIMNWTSATDPVTSDTIYVITSNSSKIGPVNRPLVLTDEITNSGAYVMRVRDVEDSNSQSTLVTAMEWVPIWMESSDNEVVSQNSMLFVYNSNTKYFTTIGVSSAGDYLINYANDKLSLKAVSNEASLNSLVDATVAFTSETTLSDSKTTVLVVNIASNADPVATKVNIFYKIGFYLTSIVHYPTIGTYAAVTSSSCPSVTVAFSSTNADTTVNAGDTKDVQPLLPLLPYQVVSGVLRNVDIGGSSPKYIKLYVQGLSAQFQVKMFPTLSEVAVV